MEQYTKFIASKIVQEKNGIRKEQLLDFKESREKEEKSRKSEEKKN